MVIDIGPALMKAKETVNEGSGVRFAAFSPTSVVRLEMFWLPE